MLLIEGPLTLSPHPPMTLLTRRRNPRGPMLPTLSITPQLVPRSMGIYLLVTLTLVHPVVPLPGTPPLGCTRGKKSILRTAARLATSTIKWLTLTLTLSAGGTLHRRVCRKLRLTNTVLLLFPLDRCNRLRKCLLRLSGLPSLEQVPVSLPLPITSLKCLASVGPSWRPPASGDTLIGQLATKAGRTKAFL